MASKKSKTKARPRRKDAWHLGACPLDAPPRETWRPEWRDRATAMLRAYNDALLGNPARAAAAGRGAWVVRASSEGVLEALYAVNVWARRHSIDGVAWVRWVGRRVRSDTTALERLASLFDLNLLHQYLNDPLSSIDIGNAIDANLHARLGASGFVVGRDMHAGAEQAKANFLARGREVLCIDAHDITFGFHTASPSCARCSLRDRCQRETAFRLSRKTL